MQIESDDVVYLSYDTLIIILSSSSFLLRVWSLILNPTDTMMKMSYLASLALFMLSSSSFSQAFVIPSAIHRSSHLQATRSSTSSPSLTKNPIIIFPAQFGIRADYEQLIEELNERGHPAIALDLKVGRYIDSIYIYTHTLCVQFWYYDIMNSYAFFIFIHTYTQRFDWLKITKSIPTADYWKGTLQPRGSLDFYFEAAQAAVDEIKAQYPNKKIHLIVSL